MPQFEGSRPWAKLIRDQDYHVTAALPLLDHALDVAAVGEALLAGGLWRKALETTAGRALAAQDVARLVALMALHDIGKANAGFQARWNDKAERIGHEPQVAALLKDDRLKTTPAAQALLGIQRDWGAAPLIPALFAHHGRPREEFRGPPETGGRNLTWQKHVQHWRVKDGFDPCAAAADVIAAVRARYPQAWGDGPTLPSEPRFVAMFAGLVVLADWLGSDTQRFPVGEPHGEAREALRAEQAPAAVAARSLTPLDTPDGDFADAFPFPPRGIQREAAADDLGPVALFEAETGSGKTEAALWRWLELRRQGLVDGLFFALPTRSAAVQLHTRVQRLLDRVFGPNVIEAVLAVPGYLRAGDAEGQALPGFEVRWDDGGSDARWAAERSTRYLAARVAVGTIDQALLGALTVKHAPVRAAALSRSLLVVDEVHASDAYIGAVLKRLLTNHTQAGGHALLLSATLGADLRTRLLGGAVPDVEAAVATPYPALAGSDAAPRQATAGGTRVKAVRFEIADDIADPDAIAARAIKAARAGASVLVVRNSVKGAVDVAQAVAVLAPELAFHVGLEGRRVATLHHGRFAPSDRKRLDAAVEAAFGRNRTAQGRVLVGTQTLEQSLDIDADLLITDLAPMDVLLQRAGRLHRHDRDDRDAFAHARAIVLTPAGRILAPLLGSVPERHGLGPLGDGGGVYPNLLQLEATLRVLEDTPEVSIPADNRRLVEHALHPDMLGKIASALGTAWQNHAAECAGIVFADRQTGQTLALDLSKPFRDLVFPDMDETVATRLGARDLLVDFETPLPGPFGEAVTRLTIPRWMVGAIAPRDEPRSLGPSEDGEMFELGGRRYVYGRWGLAKM
jgi:CRISPR-associated endonuclease/helicase Cas3